MPQFLLFTVSIFLSLTWTAASHATERIEIPDEFPPHPRLFMNQDEIDQLKEQAQAEEWLQKRIEGFISYNLRDADKDYTPEKSSNSNIARKAQYLGFAYALSGEEKLARKVAEILLSYADVYPSYPITGGKGRATDSTLGEAPWAINMATAYDFIYNSGVLSDSDKARIEKNVFRPCAEVLRICNHKTKGNWRSWAFAGLGTVGFCIGEEEYIEETLNGYRDSSGKLVRYGFAQQVAESVLADGIFFERSLGYHFYTLSAYVQLAEVARHCGVDLWNLEITGNQEDAGSDTDRVWGKTGKKSLKMMFDAPFYYVFPDLSGAAVADSHTYHLSPGMAFELAYSAYKDEKYAWLLNQVKQPRRPRYDIGMMWFNPEVPKGNFNLKNDAEFALNGIHKNSCTLFPSTGYAILRENTEKDAMCVLMSYGKYGTGHDHPDKLHISVYGAGKIIMPDAGSLGYGNKEHLTWANQTIAHNTVTVDEVAQYPQGTRDSIWAADNAEKPSVGRLIFFHAGENLKAMRAECDNAYEGVIIDRTVAIVDSRVFDIYRVRSNEKHQYDYALHIDGKFTSASLELESQQDVLSPKRGYSHIKDIQRGQIGRDNCKIKYMIPLSEEEADTIPLQLTIFPVFNGEIILGNGLKTAETIKPVAIVRTNDDNTDFISVMELEQAESGAKIKQMGKTPEGVIFLEIDEINGGKSYLISMEKSQKFITPAGEIFGQFAFIRMGENGKVIEFEVVK